jgi:hypothetical protein
MIWAKRAMLPLVMSKSLPHPSQSIKPTPRPR